MTVESGKGDLPSTRGEEAVSEREVVQCILAGHTDCESGEREGL